MKKLILILSVFLVSCSDSNLEYIGKEIVDGKVSAKKEGVQRTCRGCLSENPIIWVQTPTTTREVSIPFEYENRWKVGDSCLLIIEKYKEKK